ncbi:hypothetical protein AAY473_010004 [Plecturocebus cupreus]
MCSSESPLQLLCWDPCILQIRSLHHPGITCEKPPPTLICASRTRSGCS